MEIELSPKSIARLADALAPRVAKIIKNEMMKQEPVDDEWVSTKVAASILGISQDRMRKIKGKYPHIKNGDKDQGNLRFKRSSLVEHYAQ